MFPRQTNNSLVISELSVVSCQLFVVSCLLFVVISFPVASELLVTEISPRQCRVPTQNNIVGTRHCLGLYYSGATGIDISCQLQCPERSRSVIGQPSTVNCQRSTVNGQLSTD
jgi:hypothetical protein